MGKTKHRKEHKQKVQARRNRVQQQRQSFNKLVQQLEEQIAIVQANPVTGVNIIPQEQVTLTGTLPSHEINIWHK